MKSGLLLGVGVTASILTGAVFVLFMVRSPQISPSDLTAPPIEPSPTPTPWPSPTPVVIEEPSGPRNLITPPTVAPSPVVADLIDLNTDSHRYIELGLNLQQESAIFALRCAPPVPPQPPYDGVLEGCDNGGGAGITFLDQVVEAGIMTRQEINDTFADLVVQQWR